jgi:UDP-glucose 4-epimerase
VYGDGFQTRSFAYVLQVVKAFYDLMVVTDRSIGQVVNVAGDREIEIGRLAELVKRITGSKSEIKRIPYDEAYGENFDDSYRRVGNTEVLKSLIGWVPNMPLEAIIRNTANWREGDENC